VSISNVTYIRTPHKSKIKNLDRDYWRRLRAAGELDEKIIALILHNAPLTTRERSHYLANRKEIDRVVALRVSWAADDAKASRCPHCGAWQSFASEEIDQ
jgi:hypothetical protein